MWTSKVLTSSSKHALFRLCHKINRYRAVGEISSKNYPPPKMCKITPFSTSSSAAKEAETSNHAAVSPSARVTAAAMVVPPEDLNTVKRERISSGPFAVAGVLVNLFSTVERQRAPPSHDKTCHIRLTTIFPSPFCEKARWALDLLESRNDNPYYYTEDAHPPAFHAFATLPITNYKSSVTPMAAFHEDDKTMGGGESQKVVVTKSNAIVQRFLPELYPTEIEEEIQAMEYDFGKRIGTTTRCIVYHTSLSDLDQYKSPLVHWCSNPKYVSKIENTLFDKMLDKGLDKGLQKAIFVTKGGSDASHVAIREVFDEISTKLEESGGDYLMDTKEKSFGFTAADLAFAANAALAIRPPELSDMYGDTEAEDACHEELRQLRKDLLATRAGQHVLMLYQKHRLSSAERDGSRKVSFKTVNRNKYPWQFS